MLLTLNVEELFGNPELSFIETVVVSDVALRLRHRDDHVLLLFPENRLRRDGPLEMVLLRERERNIQFLWNPIFAQFRKWEWEEERERTRYKWVRERKNDILMCLFCNWPALYFKLNKSHVCIAWLQEAAFHILLQTESRQDRFCLQITLCMAWVHWQRSCTGKPTAVCSDETSCNNLKGVGLLSLLFDCRQNYICTDVTRTQIKDRSR